jgi:hypothetical protein
MNHREIRDSAVLIGFNPEGECVYSAQLPLGDYWDGEHIWDTDSGGVESLLFYLSLLLAFPVWIAHETLSTLHLSNWLIVVLGFLVALGFDYLLSIFLAAVRGNQSAA